VRLRAQIAGLAARNRAVLLHRYPYYSAVQAALFDGRSLCMRARMKKTGKRKKDFSEKNRVDGYSGEPLADGLGWILPDSIPLP